MVPDHYRAGLTDYPKHLGPQPELTTISGTALPMNPFKSLSANESLQTVEKERKMYKILIAFLVFLAFAPVSRADDYEPFKNKVRVFVDLSDFYWDEHYNSEKLLEETGSTFGIGVAYKGIAGQRSTADGYRLTYGGRLSSNFGQVDYDGQTQSGTPAQTDVDYSGMTLEGHLGWLCKTSKNWLFIEPNLGLAFSTWSRDLQSTDTATGYKENWTNIYGRTGLTFAIPFKPNYMFSFSAGALFPLYVENEVNGIELEPEAFHLTPYANLAFEYKRFTIELFYESFLFGESDMKIMGNAYVLQPESYTSKMGLRLLFAVF